jgi:cytochrome P450
MTEVVFDPRGAWGAGDWLALRRSPPLQRVPDRGVWVAIGHQVVGEIARRSGDFTCAGGILEPWSPPTVPVLITSDGAPHRELRALIEPRVRLAPAMVAQLRGAAAALARGMADRGGGDVVDLIARPLASAAVFSVLGVPAADWPGLDALCRHALSSEEESAVARGPAEAELVSYLATLAAVRARSPRDDLISRLAVAGGLGDESIVRHGRLLLEAGLESMCDVMAGATIGLAPGPCHGGAARIVEEVLRWTSPIARFGRTATREVRIGDALLAAGDRVMLSWFGANHDPAAFPEPHELRTERRANRHLAFGAGAHRCVGARVARAVVRIFIEEVLAAWPRWTVRSRLPRQTSRTRGWARVDAELLG